MELRRELLWTLGAVVLLNLLLAFGAVGLFVRMGPAIEQIHLENLHSILAAEQMLAELAAAGGEAPDQVAQARMRRALEEAKLNVTEGDEVPVLAQLERLLPDVLEGDRVARTESVATLRRLVEINRIAVARVDDRARRLGSGGAWAAVLIGFISFALSLGVAIRLQRRFVVPLLELHSVLEANRHGHQLRRCRHPDAPLEVTQVALAVNALLDERMRRDASRGSPSA